MRSYLFQGLMVFFMLLLTTYLMGEVFHVQFGTENLFEHHGWFFLFFITLFPRLTLVFSSVPFGGFFWWLGFFFYPRVLIAVLATLSYFKQNPMLVVIAWLVAIGGEAFEKAGIKNRVFIYRGGSFGGARPQNPNPSGTVANKNDIEAEYTIKE